MGKGFVDLYLEPFWAKHNDLKYGYLIELKYIKRSEFNDDLLQEKIDAARTQLQQYAADPRVIKKVLHLIPGVGAIELQRYANDPRVIQGGKGVNLTCVTLIFRGWELTHCEEVISKVE